MRVRKVNDGVLGLAISGKGTNTVCALNMKMRAKKAPIFCVGRGSSNHGDIGRLGHGLGMQLTEQPSHAAFDATELVENMVLTIEPSLSYGAGLMMVHEENIVVRSGKAALLSTRAAPHLPVIG